MFDPYKSIGIKLYWFLREWRQTCITKQGAAGFDGTGGNGGRLEWSGSAPVPSLMMMVVAATAAASGTDGLSRCTVRASGSPRRSPASWGRCTWTPPVVLCSDPSMECCPGWGKMGRTSYLPVLESWTTFFISPRSSLHVTGSPRVSTSTLYNCGSPIKPFMVPPHPASLTSSHPSQGAKLRTSCSW